MLELCNTLDNQVTDSNCDDDRVCDGREEDDCASVTSCHSSSNFVGWWEHFRFRLELKVWVSSGNLQNRLIHELREECDRGIGCQVDIAHEFVLLGIFVGLEHLV